MKHQPRDVLLFERVVHLSPDLDDGVQEELQTVDVPGVTVHIIVRVPAVNMYM